MHNDTIVALATAEGNSGLAVVRLSGPGSVEIANRVFSPGLSAGEASHRAVYGILSFPSIDNKEVSENTGVVDQVLALPMLAPNSFTGEDTVEFFCHGGTVVSRLVVSACRLAGARPATAGEFTRRAFLNGKMSLDQAEAVADLIHAESEISARAAIRQLLGGLNSQLVEIEKPLMDLLSRMEGGLEFLDEEVAEVDPEEVARVLEKTTERIDHLLEMAPAGRLLRDGIHVVLQGEPNVGKSSLFNQLVAEDRAIVDTEAGTTRDVVSARVVRNGRVFVLHDTAGLRETSGRVEQKGIERTKDAVSSADIVLDLSVAGEDPLNSTKNLPAETVVLPVLTKNDLLSGGKKSELPGGHWPTSSNDGQGVAELWSAIEKAVEKFDLSRAVSLGVVINERHRHKLESSRRELQLLWKEYADLESAPGDEVAGTLLASILAELGEISGRVFSEQLLESVFSRFCVGK